jgi:hypothetical protein
VNASGIRGALAFAAALLVAVPGPAAAQTRTERPLADGRSFGVFAGTLTYNTWTDIVLEPWTIDPTDPGLAGIALAWPVGPVVPVDQGVFLFSVEMQLVRHFGYQDFWETSLLGAFRYRPGAPVAGFLDGFGMGVGPSYTSVESPHEGRNGAVKKSLIYWYLEVDHLIGPEEDASLFLRLHHRSSGYGTMGTSGTSNALVVGFRHSF